MKKNKYLLLGLLFPTFVFAKAVNSELLPYVLPIQLFFTLFISLFLFKPFAKLVAPDNYKKVFWTLFIVRWVILLIFDLFITPLITIIDFFVLLSPVIVIPVTAIITKRNILEATIPGVVKSINTTSENSNITNGGTNMNENENETQINENIKKDIVLITEFDPMFSYTEDKLLDTFIEKEMKKAGIENSNSILPEDVLKRKKVLNIIFSLLVFVYVTCIFFHFPLVTYIIGIFILFLCSKLFNKFNLKKYLTKEIKSRPSEKISNIIMATKNSFVEDNTKIFKLVSILVAIILPLVIFIKPVILYEEADGGYAVRYYAFGLTNFKTAFIPETHNGKPVVALRGNTFSNMPFLTEVVLPNSIKEIRGQAFKNCKSIEEITLPSNLEYIGGGFCYNCTSLKSIIIPDTVKELGGEAFTNAQSLTKVVLSNNLTEIRGNTFENCISLESVEIPDSVTRIGGHAFYGNYKLSNVYISENSKLTEIGSSAFRECGSLFSITLPRGVSVNERAFKGSPTTINYYGESYDVNNDANNDANNDIIENVPKAREREYLSTDSVAAGLDYYQTMKYNKYGVEVEYTGIESDVIKLKVIQGSKDVEVVFDSNKEDLLYQTFDKYLIKVSSKYNTSILVSIYEMAPIQDYKYYINLDDHNNLDKTAKIVSDKYKNLYFKISNYEQVAERSYKCILEFTGDINKKIELNVNNYEFKDKNLYYKTTLKMTSKYYSGVIYFN